MKTAVMYGAGKIGRGFIGKVFSDSGYEVCFLDILKDLVDALNARGRYTVRFVSNAGQQDFSVGPVRAEYSLSEQAIEEIVNCDIMATAVGVNQLPNIAPVIARGMCTRMERTGKPLDVIICENQIGADVLMRGWVYEHLDAEQRAWADRHLGLVEASIERMVPPMPPELLAEDPLMIRTESNSDLPVDRDGFRGEIPNLVGLIPDSPFEYYIKRKLFLQNGGHALCAYLGYEKGYEYIWQAMADPEIYAAAKASMETTARALIAGYGEGVRAKVEFLVTNLLERYQNRALGDTVTRVGADPARKLRRNDRIIGAALFAMEQGVDPAPILRGVAAALRYDPPGDPTAAALQSDLKQKGIEYVMQRYMGLTPDEPLYARIRTVHL